MPAPVATAHAGFVDDTGVVNVSKTPGEAEGEEPLSIDPSDPNHLVTVANTWQATVPGQLNFLPTADGLQNSAVWSSPDGGRTWAGGHLDQGGIGKVKNPLAAVPGLAPEFNDIANVANTDSASAWDRHGNAYFESGDIHGVFHNGDEVATLWRSTDNGVTWMPPLGIAAVKASQEENELDRPWLAVDNSGGPRDGTLYITFETSPFTEGTPPQVFVKSSTDRGLTWSATSRVDDGVYETQFNPRNRPVVDAGGGLDVVYDRAPVTVTILPLAQTDPIQLVLARSTDGGQTFKRSVVDGNVHRVQSPDEALSSYVEMIPAITADPVRPGHMAVAWPEALSADNSRIMLRYTLDGGSTWSPRVDIADDPAAVLNQHDHVTLSWLSDGRLFTGWRDRRGSGGAWTSMWQQWVRVLTVDAAGAHPGRSVQFTTGAHPPIRAYTGAGMPDEFQGLVSGANGVGLTWAQPTGTYTDVVFRRVPLCAFDADAAVAASCLAQPVSSGPGSAAMPLTAAGASLPNTGAIVARLTVADAFAAAALVAGGLALGVLGRSRRSRG